ncbi:MAG: hypothetical protein GTN89_05495 [Acidobacteria bacterium]|nr:hypothetical protein [Acidobacteriota bacterium]NIM61314.1 hypothetical protein [Acidobacteriota bacterium]NIO58778.1 hypothetical protein [Acidobacteriota bacterium]NIQ29821.1 hypothetical protein [Acidobacteriota bacterium]NIQ84544.1 hypothetical protein [Acidobacteriota bacterium]
MKPKPILGPAALLAGCLLAAPSYGAEDGAERSLMELVREEDERLKVRWDLFPRVRAGYPQSISAGLGVVRYRLPESWECVTTCPFRGLTLQVEPGIRGIQLSAGFGTLVAEKRRKARFLSDVHLAFGVKGVLLHRWDSSALDSAERTFAGIELSHTVTRINFSIGTLRRLERVQGGDWIVTAGMGWGF